MKPHRLLHDRPPYIKWLSDRRAERALMIKDLTLIVFFGQHEAVTITPDHGAGAGVLVAISQAGRHWVWASDVEELYDALVYALADVSYSRAELREFLGLEDDDLCADCLRMENDTVGVNWQDDPLGTLVGFTIAADDWHETGEHPAGDIADSILDMFDGSHLMDQVLDTLEEHEPHAFEQMCAWRRSEDYDPELKTERRTAIVRDYLSRHIRIERERPAAHIEEADQAELTRRLLYSDYVTTDRVAAEFAVELALNEPDRSGRKIGDYIAFILTEAQRCSILGTDDDDCWTLADDLAKAVGEARKTRADEVSQLST